jgi:hypothetical protein
MYQQTLRHELAVGIQRNVAHWGNRWVWPSKRWMKHMYAQDQDIINLTSVHIHVHPYWKRQNFCILVPTDIIHDFRGMKQWQQFFLKEQHRVPVWVGYQNSFQLVYFVHPQEVWLKAITEVKNEFHAHYEPAHSPLLWDHQILLPSNNWEIWRLSLYNGNLVRIITQKIHEQGLSTERRLSKR